ncbi:MAG: homoserine kinase [Firmicutes bacterium]|uniref:Homoserine kinase n=1 Tax=Melghirimyces thermohalophilus TaxID=1236220 RepID=A0A1G6JLN8_9BACL|nr:homoserine kinase [Melghirimyces thermohalophilus]MDA8352993.1 homoserine kinase [Bacillota bacterium]SDC19633.1 homoserine kinase [Melghirimyces thermohalophilus]
MDPFQPFEVTVPGSTANLGSGFDSIGMAVNRTLRLSFSPASHLTLTTPDPELKPMIEEEENLILKVMRELFFAAGTSLPSFHLEIRSNIPLMRGLGSSAAAIVAALVAANHLLGRPLDRETLFQQAVKWEGHPDNVGPSLFGGVVISSWDGEEASRVQAPVPPFHLVAAIPEVTLATTRARQALPEQLTHQEAVLGSSRANLLTAALLTQNWEALRVGLRDRFHQPYRSALVPGLERVLTDAGEHGAIGAALSGAGPTVIAFSMEPVSTRRFMEESFQKEGVPVKVIGLKPCSEGAKVRLTGEKEHSRLLGNIKGASR